MPPNFSSFSGLTEQCANVNAVQRRIAYVIYLLNLMADYFTPFNAIRFYLSKKKHCS